MTGFGRYRRRAKTNRQFSRPRRTEPADDEPVDQASGLTRWQVTRWAEIQDANPHSLIGNGPARTDMVAGLRALADFLEANPAVPIPRHGHTFGASTGGSDEQKLSQVKFASLAIGEDVTDSTGDGSHYSTQRQFGSVSYRIVAISDAAMLRYRQATKPPPSAKPGEDRFSRPEDHR